MNIPEAVEKSDDHAFLNIGHFRSGGLWRSLFCFDLYPVRLIMIGNSELMEDLGRYYRGVTREKVWSRSLFGEVAFGEVA